jgi:hypothetical protein
MAGNALLDYYTPEDKRNKLAGSSSGAPDQFNINWLQNTGTSDISTGEPKVSTGEPPVITDITAPPITPSVPSVIPNLLTKTTSAPQTVRSEQSDQFVDYWKQPVGSSKFNIPLDQFVRLAGMTAGAFDPNGPAGRLGNQLSQMGHEASTERARREYEAPNRLLAIKMAQAKTVEVENEASTREAIKEYEESLNQPMTVGGVTYPSRESAWKAEGKNPDVEYLKGAISTISKFNPEKGLDLRSRLLSASNADDIKRLKLDMDEKLFGMKKEQFEDTLQFKYDNLQRLREQMRDNLAKGYKPTDFEKRYVSYAERFGKELKAGKHKGEAPMDLDEFYRWEAEEKKEVITPGEQRMIQSAVATKENYIQRNLNKPKAVSAVNFFNANTDTPYVYIKKDAGIKIPRTDRYVPMTQNNMQWEKTLLPVKYGIQITGKMVQETAKKRKLSYDKVLQDVLKSGVKND